MMWFLYWWHRLRHPRKFRQHQNYVTALNAWLDGTGPQPDIHDYRP
jgi:hypothetical protein